MHHLGCCCLLKQRPSLGTALSFAESSRLTPGVSAEPGVKEDPLTLALICHAALP